MFPAGVESIPTNHSVKSLAVISDALELSAFERGEIVTPAGHSVWQKGPRRTPRRSLIVVLPENHFVSADLVTERIADERADEDVDVILACAGQRSDVAVLQGRVRDLRVLVAPVGTTGEDLRELAMQQAPGDIVTLLSGTPV
jgi:hypothetical protein